MSESERTFDVEFRVTARLTLSNEVIDRVMNNEDNWRGVFWNYTTVDNVVEHVARRLIGGSGLGDGWADLSWKDADISDEDFTLESVDEVIKVV